MPYDREKYLEQQKVGNTTTSNEEQEKEDFTKDVLHITGSVPTARDSKGRVVILNDGYENNPTQMIGAGLYRYRYKTDKIEKAVDLSINELTVPNDQVRIDEFFATYNAIKNQLTNKEHRRLVNSSANILNLNVESMAAQEEQDKAIDELENQLDELENELNLMQSEIDSLKSENDALRSQNKAKDDLIDNLQDTISGKSSEEKEREQNVEDIIRRIREAHENKSGNDNRTFDARSYRSDPRRREERERRTRNKINIARKLADRLRNR